MPAPAAARSGYQFGKYEIRGHLGTGGMGAVYHAWDPENQRAVALKILLPEAAAVPQRLERFRREARIGARLRQENIVALYEIGEFQGTYFLAMEFVEGKNLHDWIEEQGPLDPQDATTILKQMVLALDHAHQLGVVHRDIKPANILIAQGPNGLVAKLADLGVSRGLDGEDCRMTTDGHTLGTVDYMAPEQARNSGAADIRSDLYSLGCSLFHMLAGTAPFAQGTLVERVFKHAEARPPELGDFNRAIPHWLRAVCERMMAKRPEQRFQTPAELLAVLRAPEDLPATAETPALGMPEETSSTPDLSPIHSRETTLDAAGSAGREATPAAPSTLPETGPAINSQAQVAAGQFARASQVLATGNYAYGLPLLLSCCRLDPTNLLYRQALREVQRTRPKGDSWLARGRDLLLTGWSKLRLLLAQLGSDHERVLDLGEDILTRSPWDLPTQLVMAQAAEAAGWPVLAQWLLEQAAHPDNVEVGVHRALGLVLEKKGDFRAAIKQWKQVAKAVPHDVQAAKKIRDLTAQETMVRGQYLALFEKTKKSPRGRVKIQ